MLDYVSMSGSNSDPGQGLTPEQYAWNDLYRVFRAIATGELVPENAIDYRHDEEGGVTMYAPLSLLPIAVRTLTGERPAPDAATRIFVGDGGLRDAPEAEWFCTQPLTVIAYKLPGRYIVGIDQQGVSREVYDEVSRLVTKYRQLLAECL